MRNKIILVLLIIVSATLLVFNNKISNQNQLSEESNKMEVITTLFPLLDMAKNIAGNKAQVTLLLPPGVESHSFEPKPSDFIKINEADIFIYTGKYMETWAEDIIKGVTNSNLKIVDSSSGIKEVQDIELLEHDEEKEHHENSSEETSHKHSSVDPHIWLNFDYAQIMADNITQALIEKDPTNKEYYINNSLVYKEKLIALDEKYKKTLSSCKTNTIVYAGHYAFGHLADRYNLKYLAAQGLSPDAEPTASDLIDLVDQINKQNINYVFYEELTSPKIAQTISNETQAKILLLNAAHNISKEDLEKNLSFLDILNYNLDNLRTGLQCQ